MFGELQSIPMIETLCRRNGGCGGGGGGCGVEEGPLRLPVVVAVFLLDKEWQVCHSQICINLERNKVQGACAESTHKGVN